eukprot:1346132-Amorphochlora_amoeboformis.AAC.2
MSDPELNVIKLIALQCKNYYLLHWREAGLHVSAPFFDSFRIPDSAVPSFRSTYDLCIDTGKLEN